MPIYEFTCLACGKDFSVALSLRSYELKGFACPACHSKEVERTASDCQVVTSRKS